MGNQVDGNKFTWVIKDFCSLQSEIIYSEEFMIGGCKWRLMAYPRGDGIKNYMALYLESLTCGRRIVTSFNLKVVNQISDKLSQQKDKNNDFDHKTLTSGFVAMILRTELLYARGFLVNGEVKIEVEMESVVVSEEEDSENESEETGSPLKKMKLNNGGAMSIDLHVHGFHVLPSQVKFVSRIFKKHPDIALGFRAKNQHLRTLCMNVLLCLIETLCTSPQELSNEDLLEANNSLAHLKVSGFKVDWLETKLDQVQVKKVREQCGETRMQELEKKLKELKQQCLDCEALLVKETTEVLAARAALTLDDFV